MAKFSVSERFVCKVLGQQRSTPRKKPHGRADEDALTADIIRLASHYGRYGYRRITAMLRWMRQDRTRRRELGPMEQNCSDYVGIALLFDDIATWP
jgi:hypothetical protein